MKLSPDVSTSPHAILTHLSSWIRLRPSPFKIQLCYFVSSSLLGFALLKVLPYRPGRSGVEDLDLLFMSVSAVTLSSLDTVEMERFSNPQLAVLTFLMLMGGEVFTSMLELLYCRLSLEKKNAATASDRSAGTELPNLDEIRNELPELKPSSLVKSPRTMSPIDFRLSSLRCLFFAVLGYLILTHLVGFTLLSAYLSLVPSAEAVLKGKGIHAQMFSIFTTVSSFANCGFLPTNENMIVFRYYSGLLIIVMTQVLMGNTLYPSCLRLVLWVLKKISKRSREYEYILRNIHGDALEYDYLCSTKRGIFLALTVIGFVLVQLILLLCMEWGSEGLSGLSPYQKVVSGLFISVNSRHAGESTIDLSTLAPAILVLFVVMIYLPPGTHFLPTDQDECEVLARYQNETPKKKKRVLNRVQELIMLPPISCLTIFIILILITERKKLHEDPLNFNAFNIVVEVVSGYGNVGFSSGYSCERQLKPDRNCKDECVGFAAKWSSTGKLILIVVMFYGRLKRFRISSSKAWKLNLMFPPVQGY